jgi:hypothetical protein
MNGEGMTYKRFIRLALPGVSIATAALLMGLTSSSANAATQAPQSHSANLVINSPAPPPPGGGWDHGPGWHQGGPGWHHGGGWNQCPGWYNGGSWYPGSGWYHGGDWYQCPGWYSTYYGPGGYGHGGHHGP